jgi:hypothetical protein
MHRSSESVAAIVTALAKAQTELSNPEKAMIGTVYNNRSDSPQSFRYASLSSGLDIIRKSLAPDSHVVPTPNGATQLRTEKPGTSFIREKLDDDESAAVRAQLIQEIETVPEDELQSRAIAILKAKNRLSANDAKLVEESFSAKVALQAALPESSTTNELTSTPTDPTPPQPPSGSIAAVKPVRARGRPRKVKAAAEQSAAPPVPPKPAIDDSPPASTHFRADVTPAKIDKSMLTFGETRRLRDKAHLKFVASQPCLVCGRSPADAHHLRFAQPRAMGRKVSDEFTVPLCRTHHRDNHRFGDEAAWWGRQAIDPVGTSRKLWVSTRRIE